MQWSIILILLAFLSNATPLCLSSHPDGFEGCPCNWVHREGKCYKLFKENQTFDQAEATCLSQGSHLTSINSKQEHDFLLSYILREVPEEELKYVWIGGLRKRTRYIWTDLQPFLYQDWHAVHPAYSDLEKHPTLNCVQLVTTAGHYKVDPQFGTMVNHPCAGTDNFICQRMAVSKEGRATRPNSNCGYRMYES